MKPAHLNFERTLKKNSMKTNAAQRTRLGQFLTIGTCGLVHAFFGLLVVVLLLATPLRAATPPAPRSRLLIPAGQQFQLGGGQLRNFRFVGKNVGPVAVQVRELVADGRTVERGVVVPGQSVALLFGAGSRALLLNKSTRRAKFKIDASLLNPRELSMTYDKAGK